MKGELLPLTSLRFVASTLILVHHLQGELWIPEGALYPFSLGTGVSFFFVLSGFILYYSYSTRMAEFGWTDFAILRFLRVWPAHIAVILLAWLWIDTPTYDFQIPRLNVVEIMAIILLLQAWIPKLIVFFGFNGPSWSISVELFFYLSFPFLLIVLKRSTAAFVFWIGFVTAMWLWFASVVFNPAVDLQALGLGYVNPLSRLAEFAAGMLMAHSMHVTTVIRIPRLPLGFWTVAEIALLLIAVALNACTNQMIGWATNVGGPVFGMWVNTSYGLLIYPVIIYVFALARGGLSRLLSHRVMVWLGTVSFAEYLVHQPLIRYWTREIAPNVDNVPLQIGTFFLMLMFLSAVIHSFVEQPGIRLAKRVTRARQEVAKPRVKPTFGREL